MSDARRRFVRDRETRQSARASFEKRLATVRQDLAARSVPGRIKDKAQEEVLQAIDLGIDVARESKAVIAGTLGAVALWIFRRPLLGWATEQFGRITVQDDEQIRDTDQDHEEEQEA